MFIDNENDYLIDGIIINKENEKYDNMITFVVVTQSIENTKNHQIHHD